MIEDAQNKMITDAPKEKAGFHFSGDGIFRNAFIWAETIEEATAEWVRTRVELPRLPASNTSTTTSTSAAPSAAKQSTGAVDEEGKAVN